MRPRAAWVVAVGVVGWVACCQAQAPPVYLRGRPEAGWVAPHQHGASPRPASRHGNPHHGGPAVEGGGFVRSYPYHLDYYKREYGSGYDPYFGNLYGPQVVAPYAAFPYPAPYAGRPYAVCPHCGVALDGSAPPLAP